MRFATSAFNGTHGRWTRPASKARKLLEWLRVVLVLFVKLLALLQRIDHFGGQGLHLLGLADRLLFDPDRAIEIIGRSVTRGDGIEFRCSDADGLLKLVRK